MRSKYHGTQNILGKRLGMLFVITVVKDSEGLLVFSGPFNPVKTGRLLEPTPSTFQTVPNLAIFLKFIWENFEIVVSCTSTLSLPWQPSFHSNVFQNFNFCLLIFTIDLILLFYEIYHNCGFNPGLMVNYWGKT